MYELYTYLLMWVFKVKKQAGAAFEYSSLNNEWGAFKKWTPFTVESILVWYTKWQRIKLF